jgi:cytochrome d ubiquinol oxidase subunit II
VSAAVAVAVAMFAGLAAYALFGGADFGSGFYDLSAGGGRRGAEIRTQIDHSIGPVWEANHVWLIYVLVLAWTAYPTAFAAVMTTLQVPLLLALLGIVARGASFAFRKFAPTYGQARLFGVVFAGSSLIAPFFLGTVAGSIASGRVPAGGGGNPIDSWVNPTSLFTGAIAVGSCAFLAGAFLAADAARAGHLELSESLRKRALAVGTVTGVLVVGALAPIRNDAPTLGAKLTGRAAPLIALSVIAGTLALWLLLLRAYAWARVGAVLAVAAVVAGWGVAQYPWLLVDQLRITDGAGSPATLHALLVVVGLAAVLVLPALGYLYRLTQTSDWSGTEPGAGDELGSISRE